ncbi:MAG: hypothetical protein FD174_349 [Geobacteraceae bacterium]|nr:MAG: hypothetical protein FD174_349 [Geobacteraceae bacterium]
MAAIRDMVRPFLTFMALLLCLTGCDGGGAVAGGGGGISGSGVVTGQITGFGSVIVNGIRFSRKAGLADDRVKLMFENNTSAREDNLRIGMIVTVKGAFDSASGAGEYESIEFQPEIRGPLDDAGVDPAANRIRIMGRDIQVEANTAFDSIRDLDEMNGELQAGHRPELEISGNLDNAGVLHATRIARKAADFTAGPVQIKGMITTATANGFSIGTRSVVVDADTEFRNMTPTEIAAGLLVEVKGVLNGAIFTAARVEKKNAVEADVNDNVRVKGTAVGGVSNDTFTINGPNGAISVNTAAASFIKGGAAATPAIVTAGATLQVEGTLRTDGSIAAVKVSVEVEKTVKLEGNAVAGAFNAGTALTLNGVTVNIVPTTRLVDKTGMALTPASIIAGDHLQITGVIIDGPTGNFSNINASQIQRTTAGTVSFIQGPVSAKTAATLTILGVTIDTGSLDQAKDFVDNRVGTETPFGATRDESQTRFFAAVTTDGLTVVKAKGTVTGAVMTATEVELKQPL